MRDSDAVPNEDVTSGIAERMGRTPNYAAIYRKRLIDAYAIRKIGRGEVDFAILRWVTAETWDSAQFKADGALSTTGTNAYSQPTMRKPHIAPTRSLRKTVVDASNMQIRNVVTSMKRRPLTERWWHR